MKLLRILIFILIFLAVSGCSDFFMICSLHPFYLEKDIILIPAVEGIWKARPINAFPEKKGDEKFNVWNRADTASEWKVERFISRTTMKDKQGKDSLVVRPMNYYSVILTGIPTGSDQYEFRMVLFKVNGTLYADFMSAGNTALAESRLATESYFTIHTLARVVFSESKMQVSWLSAENMKEMIETKHARVSYRWVSSAKRLLLTGTPEQLTGMIKRYAGETRFINWDKQQAMLQLTALNH